MEGWGQLYLGMIPAPGNELIKKENPQMTDEQDRPTAHEKIEGARPGHGVDAETGGYRR